MTENQTLQNAYAAQLRGLFGPGVFKAAEPLAVDRGAESIEVEVLAERAGQYANTARQFGEQNSGLLDSGEAAVRQGAEIKLLAQVQAEMEVAAALLANATPPRHMGMAPAPSRAAGVATTVQKLNSLADMIDAPLAQGVEPFIETRAQARGGFALGAPGQEDACRAIEDKVRQSLQRISRQTSRSGSAALKTLFSLDAALLSKSVSVISGELGRTIEAASKGLAAAISKIIQTATRLLLQAYDWVLNLIGKDAETSARKKVNEWITVLRKDHTEGEDDEPTLMDKLLDGVYATNKINDEVKQWTHNTHTEPQALIDTCAALDKLAGGYEVKAKQVQGAFDTIGKVRGVILALPALFPPAAAVVPHLELLTGGVTLGLLGYSIFTGYDHVDSGKATFLNRFSIEIPDRVQGVRETAMKALVAP